MNDIVQLYSFVNQDRSGKVRWTAFELGLEVEEHWVEHGQHRCAPYTDINPLGQIPTVRFRGKTLVESTAICRALIDAVPDRGLDIDRGEPGRQAFHYWLSLLTESLEGRLVECAVSKVGILGPEYFELHKSLLVRKMRVLSSQVPQEGYLCGERFTLADICAGYSFRLALSCGFMDEASIQPYWDRLRARPAAVKSQIFGK